MVVRVPLTVCHWVVPVGRQVAVQVVVRVVVMLVAVWV